MTVDQILFTATKIHDWDKSVMDITKRAAEIIQNCELAVEVKDTVDAMAAKGLSPIEMLQETLKEKMSSMPPINLREGS